MLRPAIADCHALRGSRRKVHRDAAREAAAAEDQNVRARVGHDGPCDGFTSPNTMVDRAMTVIHSGVAIIGGGLVGTWTAYFLRQRGHSVAVIEKGAVGSQASGVNFGNVRIEGRHPTEFPLALRAIEQWEQIEQLIGERCEFAQCGHAYLALDPAELPRLERYQREGTAGGLEIELIGANEVRRRFPWLGPDVCSATWSKRDGTANPRLATPAVARAAQALGAEIYPEHARDRAPTHRRSLSASPPIAISSSRRRTCVNAAGAWGNEIAEMFGETSPMFPAAPPNFVTEPLPYFLTHRPAGCRRRCDHAPGRARQRHRGLLSTRPRR